MKKGLADNDRIGFIFRCISDIGCVLMTGMILRIQAKRNR